MSVKLPPTPTLRPRAEIRIVSNPVEDLSVLQVRIGPSDPWVTVAEDACHLGESRWEAVQRLRWVARVVARYYGQEVVPEQVDNDAGYHDGVPA